MGLLGLAQQSDPPSALRRSLVDAIEALKPDVGVPPQTNAWRIYHVLSQRYAQQFTLREVAASLALGTRQLGRLEASALRALADSLWIRCNLAAQREPGFPRMPDSSISTGTPTQEQELRWLKASYPCEQVRIAELLQAVLSVALPLADALRVQVEHAAPDDLAPVAVQPTTVRQALLNVVTAALRSVPGGRVSVGVNARSPYVDIHVRAHRAAESGFSGKPGFADSMERLEMALAALDTTLLPG